MITDALLQFAAAQASIRAAGSYISTNVVDLLQARDVGVGNELVVYHNVDVAFAGGTSVEFQIVTDDNAAMSSPTVIGSTGPIPLATLAAAGAQITQPLPEVQGNGERYLAVRYVGVGTFTAGSISSQIVLDAPNQKYLPRRYEIL